MEKTTPLYDCHVAAGGKIVPFGGYLLPVQYETGVIKEHMAVRTACGLFDVSHMGELMLAGPDALQNVQMFTTNDCSGMYDGQVRYSPMCNEQGAWWTIFWFIVSMKRLICWWLTHPIRIRTQNGFPAVCPAMCNLKICLIPLRSWPYRVLLHRGFWPN